MSWPFFKFQRVDLRDLVKEMKRCADALERIAPTDDDPVELKPEEAVTYVDEEKIAQREQAEAAHKLEEWLASQEEEEETPEGFGQGDIHVPRESD